MSLRKRAYSLHRWLGMIVGLQVVLWIAGGVVMSAIPIDIVRGTHLLHDLPNPDKPSTQIPSDLSWKSLSYVQRNDDTAVVVEYWSGDISFRDPTTFEELPELSENEVRTTAMTRFKQQANVLGIYRLTQIPQEVSRLSLPMYKVVFDDWKSTTLYVSPKSGNIESVRTDIWRFYDFFWMLHIMDYKNRSDFNNPLVIIAATLSLLMVASGLLLLYYRVVKPMVARRNGFT